jgi:hypothetical protein
VSSLLVVNLLLALPTKCWVVLAQQASRLVMEMLASVATTSVETALDL